MAKTVLVVEDEESLRDLYTRVFTAEGYSVTQARTVAEGRDHIRTSSYDLLISDLVLADGAGTELFTLAADLGTQAGLILVSGAIENWETPLFVEKYGLDYCFTKPFQLGALVEAVKALLD